MGDAIKTKNEPNELSLLEQYSSRMGLSDENKAFDRDNELKALSANLEQHFMNNIVFTSPPGAGKTKVVEYWSYKNRDTVETYSVDLAAMGAEGENVFAHKLRAFMREVEQLADSGKEICLFIDEFHMLGMSGYASGVEALKPAFARGEIRLIGATTDEEYIKHILKNKAFEERLNRFPLPSPSDDTTFQILVNIWKNLLPELEINEKLLRKVVEYTNRYMPADSQPRKSINVLDAMYGWYKSDNKPIDENSLDEQIYLKTGANTKWKVDINYIRKVLNEDVKGQDHALNSLLDGLEVAVANLNDPSRPMGSYIFTGPTGVGKTQTSRAMAKGIFGSEKNMIRFDMSEYQLLSDVPRFRFDVTDAVNNKQFSVILFDEIEKSHSGVMDLLLQLLDDGHLKDRYDRETTFKNAYIILTTNVGHKVFQEAQEQTLKLSDDVNTVRKSLLQDFRPELIGRLDKIIPFNSLDNDTRSSITLRELTEFTKTINDRGIYFYLESDVDIFITSDNTSNDTYAGGARDIKNRLKEKLYVPVAKLLNRHPNTVAINVGVFGQMSATDKNRLVSEANLDILMFIEKSDNNRYYLYEGSNDLGRRGDKKIYNALDFKAHANRTLMTSYAEVKEYLRPYNKE